MSEFFAYAWLESADEVYQLEAEDLHGLAMGLCDLYDRHEDLSLAGGMKNYDSDEDLAWSQLIDDWRKEEDLDGYFLTYYFDERVEEHVPFEDASQHLSLMALDAFIDEMNDKWQGSVFRLDIFLEELSDWLLLHSLEMDMEGMPLEVGVLDTMAEVLFLLSYFEFEINPLGGLNEETIQAIEDPDGAVLLLPFEIVEIRERKQWWLRGPLQLPTLLEVKFFLAKEGTDYFDRIRQR